MFLYSIVRSDGVIMLSGFRERQKAEETLSKLCRLPGWTSDPDWTYHIEEKDIGHTRDFIIYTDDSETIYYSDFYGHVSKVSEWRVISDTKVEYRAYREDGTVSIYHVLDYPNGDAQKRFIENARKYRDRQSKTPEELQRECQIEHVNYLCRCVSEHVLKRGINHNYEVTLLHYIYVNREVSNISSLISLYESYFGAFSMPESDPYKQSFTF